MSAHNLTIASLLRQGWLSWLCVGVAIAVLWTVEDKLIVTVCWLLSLAVWLIATFNLWRRIPYSKQTVATEPSADNQTMVVLQECSRQLNSFVESETNATVANIDQLQTLTIDAGEKLRSSFNGLQDKSISQQQLLGEVLGSLQDDSTGNTMNFSKFIAIII